MGFRGDVTGKTGEQQLWLSQKVPETNWKRNEMGGKSKEFEHDILEQGWEDGFQDGRAARLKSKADALGR